MSQEATKNYTISEIFFCLPANLGFQLIWRIVSVHIYFGRFTLKKMSDNVHLNPGGRPEVLTGHVSYDRITQLTGNRRVES